MAAANAEFIFMFGETGMGKLPIAFICIGSKNGKGGWGSFVKKKKWPVNTGQATHDFGYISLNNHRFPDSRD
jgi:hypothetical protein